MKTFSKLTVIAAIILCVSCKQNPAETPEHKAMVTEHSEMEESHNKMEAEHSSMKDDHQEMEAAHKAIEDDSIHLLTEKNHKILLRINI